MTIFIISFIISHPPPSSFHTEGECFVEWRQASFKLQKIDSPFAKSLADSIKAREPHLLDNEVFLAAVWVDARSRVLLTNLQKENAKRALRAVHHRLQKTTDSHLIESSPFENSNSHQQNHDSELDFQAYLDSLEQPAETVQAPNDFDAALTEVEKLGRVKKDNVFEIISQYPPIVHAAANTVSCLPSTQVSVERLFSQLKLVMRDNRSRMAEDLIDAILFLRSNKCI